MTEWIVGGGWRVNNEWVQAEQHVRKTKRIQTYIKSFWTYLKYSPLQLHLPALRQ